MLHEYAWNLNHEDLARARGAFIPSSANPSDGGYGTDHGTAVLGELVGTDNGLGVTGLVPNARVAVVNHTDRFAGYNPAKAIDIAAANMTRGDVMLLEAQMRGWNCPANQPQCYVPIEWDAGVFAAIQRATAAGIIVVEAAGNGNQNLDDPYYASRFGPNAPDSGAIIVGAGGSGCRARGQPLPLPPLVLDVRLAGERAGLGRVRDHDGLRRPLRRRRPELDVHGLVRRYLGSLADRGRCGRLAVERGRDGPRHQPHVDAGPARSS